MLLSCRFGLVGGPRRASTERANASPRRSYGFCSINPGYKLENAGCGHPQRGSRDPSAAAGAPKYPFYGPVL